MSVESDGSGGIPKFVKSVPPAVWALIIGQFITLMVWAIRLDKRVEDNEKLIATTIQQDTVPGQLLKVRVDQLDARQKYITNYVLFLREEIARKPPFGGASPPPLLPMQPSTDAPGGPNPMEEHPDQTKEK